ncbi:MULTISPECIES: C40 family peptidase [unclassified Streptomyces]|uniref:C40 family peptidase n=1 Tax=Streptomyces sp. NBC_00060 TaxID=2975636 RepID=A0AAU2GTV1_9ACTN
MKSAGFQSPGFAEVVPDDCGCAECTSTPVHPGAARSGLSVRGALAAAVGAAVLVGVGSGAASAEPIPKHAGWDGSKYWYQDATGWWRWTSHYDKYRAHTGQSPDARAATPSPPAARPGSEPVFRGKRGWDAIDGVYWYQRDGQWWWTSHKDKYERQTRGTDSRGAGASRAAGTPLRYGTEAAISFAMSQLGDPYVWGGNGPDGWDCSGLVQAAYRRAGVSLPRVANDQYRATTSISRGELRRGDLVFWSSDGSAQSIHHVAIYLGNDQYLEAPRPGKKVRVSSFSSYNPNLYGRVR